MKNATTTSRWLGRSTSTAEERSVSPSTYGRSVCVVSATVNTTKITVGSFSAPNVRSRLEPSCANGLPAVDRRQRDREPRHPQDQPAGEDVAHVPERQPEARQHRDQQRHRRVARETHIRRGAEHRTGGRRQHRLLAHQLRDVVVRLQDPRPVPLLHDRLDAGDHAAHERARREHRQDLQDLDQPVGQRRHGGSSSFRECDSSKGAISRSTGGSREICGPAPGLHLADATVLHA